MTGKRKQLELVRQGRCQYHTPTRLLAGGSRRGSWWKVGRPDTHLISRTPGMIDEDEGFEQTDAKSYVLPFQKYSREIPKWQKVVGWIHSSLVLIAEMSGLYYFLGGEDLL